jgi:hypothetical protein
MAQPNGLGWIIVDALDTMMIMNLTKELKHAREWVSTTLDYDKDQDVNTFETTIRMLGGLLSAHYLQETLPGLKPENSKDEDIFLEKAVDLADRLMGAYESPSGVPWASVRLNSGKGEPSHADGGASSTAEATTLQLEMKYLAYLTGEQHYWERAEKVMQVVDNNGAQDGLVPIFIYADKGTFRGNEIRLGSRGDSYYEYLIKQYLQTQKQEPVYLDMWEETLRGVKKHLITYTKDTHLTVLAERPNGLDGKLHPKMDHLVCFMPGTIALATTGGATLAEAKKSPNWGKKQEEDMELARELTKTCMGMYRVTATGLSPEIAHFELDDVPKMYHTSKLSSTTDLDTSVPDGEGWKKDFVIKPADAHNLQRPETVESLFYMWRITHDDIYREWGWQMFESFTKHTLVAKGGGFTSVGDVRTIPPPSRDNMESFWLVRCILPTKTIHTIPLPLPQQLLILTILAGRNTQIFLPSLRARRRPAPRPNRAEHGSPCVPALRRVAQALQDWVDAHPAQRQGRAGAWQRRGKSKGWDAEQWGYEHCVATWWDRGDARAPWVLVGWCARVHIEGSLHISTLLCIRHTQIRRR